MILSRYLASNAPIATPNPSNPKPKMMSGGWSGTLLLLPAVVAAFLGNWQLERKEWKENIIKQRSKALKFAPLDLTHLTTQNTIPSSSSSAAAPSFKECTPVTVQGVFDDAATVFVGPRPKTIAGVTQKGYLAITPLKTADKRTYLVLRGWVPDTWKINKSGPSDPTSQRQRHSKGTSVQIYGVVRFGEIPNRFVPDNEPTKGNWYYIHPQEVASHLQLPTDTPLIEIVNSDDDDKDDEENMQTKKKINSKKPSTMDVLGGRRVLPQDAIVYPIARNVGDVLEFGTTPQGHMNYAATWFSLSAATAFMAIKAIRQGRMVK
jgi:surfeit locus 1 family protein